MMGPGFVINIAVWTLAVTDRALHTLPMFLKLIDRGVFFLVGAIFNLTCVVVKSRTVLGIVTELVFDLKVPSWATLALNYDPIVNCRHMLTELLEELRRLALTFGTTLLPLCVLFHDHVSAKERFAEAADFGLTCYFETVLTSKGITAIANPVFFLKSIVTDLLIFSTWPTGSICFIDFDIVHLLGPLLRKRLSLHNIHFVSQILIEVGNLTNCSAIFLIHIYFL